MSKKDEQLAGLILGVGVLGVMGLSNLLGVSIPSLISFLFPIGILAVVGVCVGLYFWGSHFSRTGISGFLILGTSILWLNSLGLWHSYGFAGKEATLGSMLVPSPQSPLVFDPVVVHPFVFTDFFTCLWAMIGVGLVSLGGYLIYTDRYEFD